MFSNPVDQLLEQAEKQSSKALFWLSDSNKLKYTDLLSEIKKAQSWLATKNVKSEQRILFSVSNSLSFFSLLIGAWRSGMVAVFIDPNLTEPERKALLDRIQPRFVCAENIADFEGLTQAEIIPLNTNKVRKGLLMELLPSTQNDTSYPAVIKQHDLAEEAIERNAGDDALILFSSGTTSKPKAVVLSFGALLNNIDDISRKMAYKPKSRIHVALPFYHVDGLLQGPVSVLRNGATLVRSHSFDVTQIESFVGEMFRHRITHLVSVPTILAFIERTKDAFEGLFQWPEFKGMISTAGVLNETLWKKYEDNFGVRICNLYGLSETTIGATIAGPDTESYKIGSIGKPLDSVDLKLSDDGEILLKGDMLFSRYLDNDDLTQSSFENGWFKTGDLASMDNQGRLFLQGRSKNIIIKGGENISPEEVREALLSHAGVFMAEVIGLDDTQWGENIVACIVANEQPISDQELMAYAATKLAPSKLPDRFLRFEELPLGPAGKVRLQELKKQCSEKLLYQSSDVEQYATRQILEIASNIFKVSLDSLSRESRPENTTGWDSLAHLDFILEIEKVFEIKFSAREMLQMDNMAAVIDQVGNNKN